MTTWRCSRCGTDLMLEPGEEDCCGSLVHRIPTESDICPATLAHGIGVYHCRLLGAHREHQAGDLRWSAAGSPPRDATASTGSRA